MESLQIHQIEWFGLNEPLNSSDLLQQIPVKVGDPLFQADLQALANTLLKNPWIKEVRVSRKIPASLQIFVSQHQPKVILKADAYYYIDHEGKIFKRIEHQIDSKDYPILSGLEKSNMESDPPKAKEIIENALSLLKSYEASKLAQSLGVSEIHYEENLGLSLIPEKQATKIQMGFGDFEQKVKRLTQAFEKLEGNKLNFVSMDLNYAGKVILSQERN